MKKANASSSPRRDALLSYAYVAVPGSFMACAKSTPCYKKQGPLKTYLLATGLELSRLAVYARPFLSELERNLC